MLERSDIFGAHAHAVSWLAGCMVQLMTLLIVQRLYYLNPSIMHDFSQRPIELNEFPHAEIELQVTMELFN